MIQAIGLTKTFGRGRVQALVDLTFEAHPGQVSVLLGPAGAGKTVALRLMLGQERGQGATFFDGRPYLRIRRPEREIGVLAPELTGAPGHPGRRARSHVRMLAAAVGVPAKRVDQVFEQTRLTPAAGHRLGCYSPGMSRRLLLAVALLGDPHTLLLDDPTAGLSPKNVEWFRAFLRAFAGSGGTVVLTCSDPEEAARLADRVLILRNGRLLADQSAGEFVRSRLRGEILVRGPQVGRLADLLVHAGAEVRMESGSRILVCGADCSEIGELAYRHGILLHELSDRGSTGRRVPAEPADRSAGAAQAVAPQSGPAEHRASGSADHPPRSAVAAASVQVAVSGADRPDGTGPASGEAAGAAATGELPAREVPSGAMRRADAASGPRTTAPPALGPAAPERLAAPPTAPFRAGSKGRRGWGEWSEWSGAAPAVRAPSSDGPHVDADSGGMGEGGAGRLAPSEADLGETVVVLKPGAAVTTRVRSVAERFVPEADPASRAADAAEPARPTAGCSSTRAGCAPAAGTTAPPALGGTGISAAGFQPPPEATS